MDRITRVSVPVSHDLLEDLQARPAAYGVAGHKSEAARLQALLEAGAQVQRQRVEEEAMAAAYDEWSRDEERREAVAGLADLLLAEGGFADGMLRQPRPSR